MAPAFHKECLFPGSFNFQENQALSEISQERSLLTGEP